MSFLKNHQEKIFNTLLVLIGATMLFRQLCTYVIIVFVIFSLLNYKSFNFANVKWKPVLLIASPFLLDLLFLWNNDSFLLGIKMAEKRVSLLIIPLLVLGYKHNIYFYKILRLYSIVTTLLVLFFVSKYFIVNPDLFFKYLSGVELWEMGYKVANQVGGMHAPALNMHLAYVSIIHFYFVFRDIVIRKPLIKIILNIGLLICSLVLVLVINTRMAIVITFFGYFTVGGHFLFNKVAKFNKKKVVLISFFAMVLILVLFVQKFPYLKIKFSDGIFKHMDKIGKVDEIESAISQTGTLVFRLSMWKATLELAQQNLPFGVGASDGKKELVEYYNRTGQKFLAKYKFPVHNQFLDFLLKFGLTGFVVVVIFMFNIGRLAFISRNPIILSFFVLFLCSNLTDDFLIRFDGIAFSALWVAVFAKEVIVNNQYRKQEILKV